MFDKTKNGIWVFHFFPEVVASPMELAEHGRPELVDQSRWHAEAGCLPGFSDGVFAYADPRKELDRHAFNDPNGFLHGREPDPTVRVNAFPEDPVWSGREFGIEWAVYASPVAFSWNGYARIPAQTHPWWGLDHDGIRAGGGLSYGCDRDGWIGFDTLDEAQADALMLAEPERRTRIEKTLRQLGVSSEYGPIRLSCEEVADRARGLAFAIYKKEHGARIPGFRPDAMD